MPDTVMMSLCLEDRVLLACARQAIYGDITDTLEALLERGLDWTRLVESALAHKVSPLLHLALSDLDDTLLPDEIRRALNVHSDESRARCLNLTGKLFDVLAAASQRRIAAIAFNGPVLADSAYGDAAFRWADEISILLHPEDVGDMVNLLLARGYREHDGALDLGPSQCSAYRRTQSRYRFVRERDTVILQLHWRISPATTAVSWDHDGLWRRAKSVAFGGGGLVSLTPEDMLLVVCADGFEQQWLELRQVCDVAALVRHSNALDWDAVTSRAGSVGIQRMLLVGVALARDLLGACLPTAIENRLENDKAVMGLVSETRRRMFPTDYKVPAARQGIRFCLRFRERLSDRLAYAGRALLTPTLTHYRLLALPDALSFLYYPLKPAHAYLVRLAAQATRRLGWRKKERGDFDRIKQRMKLGWSEHSSEWTLRAERRSESDVASNRALLDAARVRPGQVVLDLAVGAGDPTVDVAERLAGRGSVMAVDLSLSMLTAARARVAARATTAIRFAAADMEALPFAGGVFDSAVCRLGIMFCPRVSLALAEAHRVLKPGARMAFMVWGPRANNTVFHVLEEAIGNTRSPDEPGRELTPFRFASPDHLGRAMHRAGFTEIQESELRFETRPAAGEPFWLPALCTRYGAWFRSLSPSAQAVLQHSLGKAFDAYRVAGGYRLQHDMRLVAGSVRPRG